MGVSDGDETGNWTYTGGRGESMIDYVLVNEEIRQEVVSLEIGKQVDSDHHPVEICMRDGEGEGEREREKRMNRGIWDEEGRELFKTELERMEMG